MEDVNKELVDDFHQFLLDKNLTKILFQKDLTDFGFGQEDFVARN